MASSHSNLFVEVDIFAAVTCLRLSLPIWLRKQARVGAPPSCKLSSILGLIHDERSIDEGKIEDFMADKIDKESVTFKHILQP